MANEAEETANALAQGAFDDRVGANGMPYGFVKPTGEGDYSGSRRVARSIEEYDSTWWLSTMNLEKQIKDGGLDPQTSGRRLYFYCNPNSYSVDLPLRQIIANTKGGPILHHALDKDRNNTLFGFGTISVEFQSGNILPVYNVNYSNGSGSKYIGVPTGLRNYYRYLEIVQEDNLYKDSDGKVQPNYRVLSISTRLFPRLTLYGFFLGRVGHQESAENPNEIQGWSSEFQVIRTDPDITQQGAYDALKTEWMKQMSAGSL